MEGFAPDASAERAAAGPLSETLATILPRPIPAGVARANTPITTQKRSLLAPESTMEDPKA